MPTTTLRTTHGFTPSLGEPEGAFGRPPRIPLTPQGCVYAHHHPLRHPWLECVCPPSGGFQLLCTRGAPRLNLKALLSTTSTESSALRGAVCAHHRPLHHPWLDPARTCLSHPVFRCVCPPSGGFQLLGTRGAPSLNLKLCSARQARNPLPSAGLCVPTTALCTTHGKAGAPSTPPDRSPTLPSRLAASTLSCQALSSVGIRSQAQRIIIIANASHIHSRQEMLKNDLCRDIRRIRLRAPP